MCFILIELFFFFLFLKKTETPKIHYHKSILIHVYSWYRPNSYARVLHYFKWGTQTTLHSSKDDGLNDQLFFYFYRNMPPVQSCPLNLADVEDGMRRLGCRRDKYGNNQYMCLPNVEKTSLVEFCYDGIMGIQEKGTCIYTYRSLYYYIWTWKQWISEIQYLFVFCCLIWLFGYLCNCKMWKRVGKYL